ncbi:MAG: flagellin [Myxococcota bacterium]|nr:flagellin [Myxococcota bacterium]
MSLRIGETTRFVQRDVHSTDREIENSARRIASGKRLDRATDDGGALRISEVMTSEIKGYTRAARNAFDGMGLARQADVNLGETVNVLQKIQTLAIQSANDVNTDAQRDMLQMGVAELLDELDRIGGSAEFASMKLLDGTFKKRAIHIGMNRDDRTLVSLDDARASHLGRYAVRLTKAVGASGIDRGELQVNGITIRTSLETDDAVSTTLNRASAIAKAAAINDSTQHSGVSAFVEANSRTGVHRVLGGTLDTGNHLVINRRAISGFFIRADDADETLVAAINQEVDHTGVRAHLDRRGAIELIADDGRNIELSMFGNAHLITGLGSEAGHEVDTASLNLFSSDFFSVTDPTGNGGELAIGMAERDLVSANDTEVVRTINISSRTGANRALVILDRALEETLMMRGEMGALENRLEFTVSRLNTAAQGAHAARSKVVGIDFAAEVSKMARSQILQKAFTNVLAQANTAPQRVMQLL